MASWRGGGQTVARESWLWARGPSASGRGGRSSPAGCTPAVSGGSEAPAGSGDQAVGAARAPLGERRDGGGAHVRVAGERGETRSTVLEGAEWPSERFLKVRDSVSRTRAPTLCASRSPRGPAASAPTAGGRDGAGRAGDSGWRRHGNHKPCPPEWGTPPRGGWGPDQVWTGQVRGPRSRGRRPAWPCVPSSAPRG